MSKSKQTAGAQTKPAPKSAVAAAEVPVGRQGARDTVFTDNHTLPQKEGK